MSRRGIAAAAVVAAALAGLGVFAWLTSDESEEVLTLYGNVDVRQVDLAFRVGGRIAAVRPEEGDRVDAGDLVARLDPEPFRQALALQEAEVAEREADLARLHTGSRPEEIERAAARVAELEAGLEDARRHYRRQLQLLDAGVIAPSAYDDARARKEEAEARLRSAREELQLAREGFRAEDVDAGRARLDAAAARRDRARTDLEDTRLHAPGPGTVLTRVREPGAVVAPGQTVLTLTLEDPVRVRAWVPEPDLGRIAPGMRAEVYTDSRPGRPYQGQIGFIAPEAEFTPRSVETPELRTALVYRLRVVVEDPGRELRQGMPVTVRLPEARPRSDEDD